MSSRNTRKSAKKSADQSGDMMRSLKLQDTWIGNGILDCGASYTVLSKQIVQALKPVIADTTAKLDLEIEIDAGRVVLTRVTCYLVDENTGAVMYDEIS